MTRAQVSHSLLILAALGTLSVRQSVASDAVTSYVSPNGDDSWSGRLARPNADRTDGPRATLGAACRATRTLGTETSRRIVVQAGEYFLNEPVVLTEKDSGLTIEAATEDW